MMGRRRRRASFRYASGVRWDDLRCLEALARTGNAAAAGRELEVATSTIYRRIDALEEALGAPVLLRGAPTLTLTSEGERLVSTARRTRQELDAVRQTSAPDVVEGRVRLTTVEGFLPLLVAPLAKLAAAHPDLEVELHLGDSGPSVRRREADVALAVMANPPEGLVGRRLLRIGYGVFGTPEALARRPRRWVVLGPPLTHTPEAAWEREHATNVAVATGSRNAFLALLGRGVGVGLLPRPMSHEGLVEDHDLRDACAHLHRDAWTLVHPESKDVARVRAVLDVLVAALG